MPTPSLLIVPARFKTGRLYSQIPTNTDNRGDFTVTRNTAARRFDSAGLVASVASGIPRLDYYTSGGVTGCPALLVEPAATNLLSGSADFSNTTYWTRPAGANVTGNVAGISAPDGTNTASLFQASGTTTTNSRLRQTWSRTTTGSHAFSVFIKGFAGVAASGVLFCGVGASELNFAITSGGVVSLTSMTGGAAAVTSGITQFSDGWYRITAVGTAATSGSTQTEIYCSPSGGPQYYCWGAQLETGSVATSYIPTTAGTGSRSADVISVSGAVSGSIGQQSGTVYCEFQFNNTNTNNAGIFSVESTNNQNRILLANATPTTCNVQLLANNSAIFTTSIGTLTVGQYYKIAVGYSSGNTKVYLNGNSTPVITNTSGYTMAAALSRICLGNYENAAVQATNSRIRSLVLYAERLTDAEMIALTT